MRLLQRIAVFLALLSSYAASAGTGWLCEEESSQRKGDSVYACGVGTGPDENAARSQAFDHAKAEFSKVCGASDDCRGHRISAQPERTTCEKEKAGFKCYRLIVFSIGASDPTARSTATDAAPAPGGVQSPDKPESFESFTYEQIRHLPKVKKGMTKAAVLKQFGAPSSTMNIADTLAFIYLGKMCAHEASPCMVFFNFRGRVTSTQDFHVNYTEDLK